ncbi:MAG TPA: VOC family protein [Candidatus Limnocylindria bacterium]|nr:VOC family protein [Candidatus Limnocylindria bacterium]
MPQAIDHLVIAVPDPDAAADELERALGIAFPSGGRHPGVGTWNRIAFLDEPYLELIGVEDAEAAGRWPVGAAAVRALEANPDGAFATYALLDDDLDATVARLRARGSDIARPAYGSRHTPSGETVEWWTATFAHLAPDQPPFLIRHARTGAEWSDEAVRSRRSQLQPVGCVVALATLELSVPNPDLVARRYRSGRGLGPVPIEGDQHLTIGPHAVLLKSSARGEPPATVVMACHGSTARSLDRFGVRFVMTGAATS